MEIRTDRLRLNDVHPDQAKKWAKRLHVKASEIEFVRKGIPINPSDISISEGERAAIRYVSTPHLDRDMEILMPNGVNLDAFRESPVVLYAHDYNSLPIGRDIWIKPTAKGILAKTIYANHQLAQDVYDLVKDKFLNSNSVGFIPVQWASQGSDEHKALVGTLEKDFGIPEEEASQARRIYTKWVLLEHSDVPVPSNSQSLNVMVGKSIHSKTLRADLGLEETPDVEVMASDQSSEETPEDFQAEPLSDAQAIEQQVEAKPPAAEDGEAEDEQKPEHESDAPADVLITDVEGEGKADGDIISRAKAESTDINVQLLTAILQSVNVTARAITALRQEIADLKTSIPLLIMPAAPSSPESISAPQPPDDFILTLDERDGKAPDSAKKPAAEEPPATAPKPDKAKAPKPAPSKEEIRAIVVEALKVMDFRELIAGELTLAIAKIKGKVVG